MKKILIVDDEPLVRSALAGILRRQDVSILQATDGLEALAVASSERIDLILLDVCMPGMNGYDACKVLRENRRTKNIPVIMVTSLDEIEDQLYGLKCGADDYLMKPIDLKWLAKRAETLMLETPAGEHL